MVNWPQQARRHGNPEVIWAIVAAFAAIDFLTPVLLRHSRLPVLPALLVAMTVAQPGLLAVWAVLGPQRFLVRWPLSFLVAALLWLVFLAGVGLASGPGGSTPGDLFMTTLVLPSIFLAVQFPLWILKMLTGWRIVVAGSEHDSSPTESRQFGLQQMLAGTAVIAVALGLASAGLPLLDGGNAGADASMWLGLMFACLSAGVASALAMLPCLWAAFVVRNKTAGAIYIGAYALSISFLLVAVPAAIYGSSAAFGRVGEVLLIVFLFLGSLACVLLGSLHAVRACGYALLRPRRRQPPPTPAGSSPFADPGDPLPPPPDP